MLRFTKMFKSNVNDYFEEIHMSTPDLNNETFHFQKTSNNSKQSTWKSHLSCSKSSTVNLPKVRDIEIIDKLSRILFPLSFIIFNFCYFCVYSL